MAARLVAALGAAALVAAPLVARALDTTPQAIEASRRGDGARLAELARREGPRAVLAALGGDDRRARLAAVALAAEAEPAWTFLPELVALAAHADHQLAGAAVRATSSVARRLVERGLDALPPADELAAACDALAALAARAGAAPDVRAAALDVVLALAPLGGEPARADALVAALVVDGDPELRRAAAAVADLTRPAQLAAVEAQAPREPSAAAQRAQLAAWPRAGLPLPAALHPLATARLADPPATIDPAERVLLRRGLAPTR